MQKALSNPLVEWNFIWVYAPWCLTCAKCDEDRLCISRAAYNIRGRRNIKVLRAPVHAVDLREEWKVKALPIVLVYIYLYI